MSKSAIKFRDVRSTVKKEISSAKTHRSASLDTRNRGSYVPEKARSSSDERKSGHKPFNPRWGTGRKSSINLSEAKRKDLRPLTDRVYQKKKACELAEFLNEMGFSPPIDSSKLMSPSKKEFENIFQFLYKYFDPSYEVKKIEEEAPKILKNLGYPFTVNKSSFAYVARTNWPTLLGVLIWFMDLNKFLGKVDVNPLFEGTEENELTMQRILLKYIIQCHHMGTDDEENENNIFLSILKSSRTENMDDLIEKNEQKKLQLELLNKEIDKMKDLKSQSLRLDSTIEKYDDFFLKMKKHYQKREELNKALMDEMKQKELTLQALLDEISKKQDLYDAQGFDGKKRLEYFESQKTELNDTLNKKRIYVRELQSKHEEYEIEYRKQLEKVMAGSESHKKLYDSLIEEMNTLLKPLLKIKDPQIQRLISNFPCNYPDLYIPVKKYDVECRKAMVKGVENIVDRIQSTDEILKRIFTLWTQKNNEIEIKISELSMQLKLLTMQEDMKESNINAKKKQTDDEVATLVAQYEKSCEIIKTLQTKVLNLEKVHSEMVEEQNTLHTIHEKKEKQLKDYLAEQEEMIKYFEENERRVMQLYEESCNEIAEKLEEFNQL